MALKDGPLRYTPLSHAVSNATDGFVHNRTLTGTLGYLREQNLIEHRQTGDCAIYRLTAGGDELIDLLAEILRWTRQHRPDGDP